MYEKYFGLRELPFSIAPDPSYLYMSEGHREALSHLLYGMKGEGGFILLTGEVGAGKTTICRCLLEQIPQQTEIAFVLNPRLTAEELLATVCDDLGIEYPASGCTVKTYVDAINEYLLDAHRSGMSIVLIIEEAQNLSFDVLEQLRLLTNLETDKCKLLQIILLGQPELLEMLSKPELRPLAQRITARYHLGPLLKKEVPAYVAHRLSIAGGHGYVFPQSVMGRIYRFTGGIPRLINLLCDRALLGVYAEGKERVDPGILKKSADEVFGKRRMISRPLMAFRWALTGIFAAACSVAFSGSVQNGIQPQKSRHETVIYEKSQKMSDRQNPKVDTLSAADGISASESLKLAYQSLFGRWRISYVAEAPETACEQAKRQNMQCLTSRGDIETLKQLNKPAILCIAAADGRELYAVLSVLNGKTAAMDIAGQIRQFDIGELASVWSGEYTVLIRMPLRYDGSIHQGARGEAVRRIERHIALIKGRQARTEIVFFDDFLLRDVREFQMIEGLKPDGIVGPETIMRLNTAVVSRDPFLLDNKKGI